MWGTMAASLTFSQSAAHIASIVVLVLIFARSFEVSNLSVY